MAVSDLCQTFGTELLPLLDVGGAAQPLKSLLSQLLLKVHISTHSQLFLRHIHLCLVPFADTVIKSRLLPKASKRTVHSALEIMCKTSFSMKCHC